MPAVAGRAFIRGGGAGTKPIVRDAGTDILNDLGRDSMTSSLATN